MAQSSMEAVSEEQQQQQHHQQPTISISTPSKRLYDIGKKLPPLQTTSCEGDEGGGENIGGTESGIVKTATTISKLTLVQPSTPRIEFSRASSSSHHDSRDSSPENVFEQVGTGTLQEAIGFGFREEGALDLRSSTEELYFMDPEQKKEEHEKMQQARKSPIIFKFDEHQTYLQQHQRKDSASSEVAALLCISGRSSRISSVGSQGSAVSRLSAISGVSRSPSPHRMLLETSFCGPKPLDSAIDGGIANTSEAPTAEALEQILLSRKHDPTQVVLAEGIHIETSPKKKLINGETKVDKTIKKPSSAPIKIIKKGAVARRDSCKQVVGVTPSGTEYIRIKLKPDHMYHDHGIAPNERVIEVPLTSSGAQKKPVTLSLGRDISGNEQRLTPSSSPKPTRHGIFVRDIAGSRSPSPATVAVSRKSSFCSLFKSNKDSPDSPRDRSRSRSKSRDRSTPQSLTGTPSKQKSVLAIFKPKRSGSKSKCSSPIDQEAISQQLDGISQVEFKFKSDTTSEQPSRPSSRLRYYDTPLDGKSIHIPLHTPPEEKADRQFLPSSQKELKEPEPPPPITETKILKTETTENAPILPPKSPKPQQLEKITRIENLDAIHILPDDVNENERTWSLEVERHSSLESQETIASENAVTLVGRRISKLSLSDVVESPVKENGTATMVPQPTVSIPSTIQQSSAIHTIPSQTTAPTTKEKRRILFATKLGSGSEEQIFSTQFSISKTESLSSQLSEQTIPESPALEGKETLHRTDTVIRRIDEISATGAARKKEHLEEKKQTFNQKIQDNKPAIVAVIQKVESSEEYKVRPSRSTSEEEDKKPVVVMMRKKDPLEEIKRKSRSASEEDDNNTHRHSRYLENFDVKKKFQENNATKPQANRNSSDSSIKERDSRTSSREDQENHTTAPVITTKSKHFQPSITLPQPAIERQSMVSTDEPFESSESEKDSEMDPNRIKKHLPRHIGAIEDHESTGLVSQDSYDDELPYIPTTLPEERAHGVALVPMKERINMELKTYSVDRPRSTTPMNPACLEEYCGIVTPDDVGHVPIRGEKLRISLPRKDSLKDRVQKSKSPRRTSNASGKSWFEFAEQGIKAQPSSMTATNYSDRRTSFQDEEPPPPLPPRKPLATGSTTGQWINFENIPEKRKLPKRITALPKDSPQEPLSSKAHSIPPPIHYNYVKPEECQCECHEMERESGTHKSIPDVDLLQQGEDMEPLLEPESQEGIDPSEIDYSYDVRSSGCSGGELLDRKLYEKELFKQSSTSNRPRHKEDTSPDRSSSRGISSSKSRKTPEYKNS